MVGAGIAGATVAYQLARRARRVTLVEAAGSPERAGACWVNGVERSVFEELGLGTPPSPAVVFSAPQAFSLQSPGGARVRAPAPPTWDIDMRGLQAWMLELARGAGAEVRFGARAVAVRTQGRAAAGVVLEDGEELPAALTVDAGGLRGAVRGRLPEGAWDDPDPELGPADVCLAHQEVRELTDPGTARAFLREHGLAENETLSFGGVSGGYSVVNVQVDLARRRASFLSGAKLDAPVSARRLILDLAARLGFTGQRLFGGGGKVPLRRSYDLLVGDGFALCGDAACQVFPSHGSGVAAAMRAGTLLAEVADAALAARDLSRAALWPYAARWQRGRGAVSAAHDVLRRFSETLAPDEVDRLLRGQLLGPEELRQSLACEPMQLDPVGLLRRAPRVLRVLPWLARRFAPAVRRALGVQRLYGRFPARWDEGAFRLWQAEVRRSFREAA